MVSKLAGAGGGALSGAGTGATIGSAFGPIGTGIGAVGGGLIGGVTGYLSAEPDQVRNISTQNPGQEEYFSRILDHLKQMEGQGGVYQQSQDYVSKLLSRDPETYDRFAAPYLQQFEQQTIPRLAEQFAGLGGGMGGGVNSSSGFGQAIGGAGAQFQSSLANLFAQLQQNAAGQGINQYNQLSNQALNTQAISPQYQPGNVGFGGRALEGIVSSQNKKAGNNDIFDVISQYFNDQKNKNKATGTDQIAQGNGGLYPTQGNYNPYSGQSI